MRSRSGVATMLARFVLVLFLVGVVVVAAIPAADEDETYARLLAGFRKAKTKEERLALLKGKKDPEIENFLLTLYAEQERAVGRGEFSEVERLLLWSEEATTLIQDEERRRRSERDCAFGRGWLAQSQDRFDEAIAIYQKVLVLAKKPQDRVVKVFVLKNLASVYLQQGHYPACLKAIADTRVGMMGFSDEQRKYIEPGLIGIHGQVLMQMSDYPEAEKTMKEALRLAEKYNDAVLAQTMKVALASLKGYQGRPAEKIAALQLLLADCRKNGDKLAEGTILNNLGQALLDYGRLGAAIKRFDESRQLAIDLKLRHLEALALFNLATTYDMLESEETGRYLNAAFKLYKETGDIRGQVKCLQLEGSLEFAAGRKEEGTRAFAQALEIAKASGYKVEFAQLNFLIGSQLYLANEPKQAEEVLGVALKAFEDLGDTRGVFLTRELRLLCIPSSDLKRLSAEYDALMKGVHAFKDPYAVTLLRYYSAMGGVLAKQWDLAISEANAGIEAYLTHLAPLEDPTLQVTMRSRSLLPDLYSLTAACYAGKREPKAAFLVGERAKARMLNQLFARRGASVRKSMTPSEQAEEKQLRTAVMVAAGRWAVEMRSANATPDKGEALEKALNDAQTKYEAFRGRLYVDHPELRVWRSELPDVNLTDLQKQIFAGNPELAIISYTVLFDRILIAVVTAGEKMDGPARVVVHTALVKQSELAEAAERYWKLCQNAKAGRPVSDDLYKWLIEPAAKDIAGKKHLLIVPCQPLQTMPFQALAPSLDEPYLIEQFAISYAPSVSALLEMRRRGDRVRGPGQADRLQMLAVGGVKFTPDMEELPASGPEAEDVAKAFGSQSRTLLAEDASRAEVVKAMPTARFIHFATHGLVNPPRPLFSALAVSPVGKEDDGRLYAHDILNLDLSAEMVVLSACNTGRGRDYRGEGTMGLAWAFFVAGTPTAVVSQWKLTDNTTAKLMRVFYDRLRSGKDASKAESLRQAALALLKTDRTRHPKYWAPFVMIGDWRK